MKFNKIFNISSVSSLEDVFSPAPEIKKKQNDNLITLLPPEVLIDTMFTFLPDADLKSLSLTCKDTKYLVNLYKPFNMNKCSFTNLFSSVLKKCEPETATINTHYGDEEYKRDKTFYISKIFDEALK